MGKTQQLGMYPNIGISSSGTPTTNYLPKFTGASTIGNSLIFDNGTNVGIGNTNTSYTLDVSGSLRSTNTAYFATTSGSVGIGTTSPVQKLQVDATTGDGIYLNSFLTTTGAADTGAVLSFGLNDGSNNRDAGYIKTLKENGTSGNYASYMSFFTRPNGSGLAERMRITSAGNVGIGTSSPSGQLDIYATGTDLATYFTQASAGNNNFTRWTRTSGPTLITGVVRNSNDGNQKANTAFIGTTNSFDFLFYTNDSERGRFTSDGWFKASNTGTYISGTFHEFSSSLNNATTFRIKATSSTFTDYIAFIHADKANNSDYSFLQARSSNTSDTEFNLRGDGNAYADGSWNGGGADYAEFFEWLDGNPNNEDRRGYSVSLVGNKIKIAQKGETIIGVISGNPSVIGDSAWNMWTEKYLRDDFGTYVRDENGFRILNPNYNPDIDYISREERPEWGIVGLMGKLCMRKGQEVMPNWVKMKDVSDSVEQWLIK